MSLLHWPYLLGRIITRVRAWFLARERRQHIAGGPHPAPVHRPQPVIPAAYLPLYTYLEGRYAHTVVLTVDQIESLIGCPLPPACADDAWWANDEHATDHATAWTAAHRHATPQLEAGIVAFERHS